ncbi:long-chain-fatty-acid--CoA ligase ACSBG2-like [Hyperolius riggenbachi]|uniref:long-chain-fatty-acid--CoA ligase ACSBG2-like n=1 Tax=Hyperolius riggenbachi TaxID=752182 RepID=UPI0035A32AC8
MSSQESPEGDSTESFVDIQEWENGKEQTTESRQEEKPPEEAHGEDLSQARGDHEEQESWETVPESEKDYLQENEGSRDNWVQSPGYAEHGQATDDGRAVLPGNPARSPAKEGPHSNPYEATSEKGSSVSQHPHCQEGETQTLKNESNDHEKTGETKSATAGSELEENERNQETKGGPEMDKPEKRNQKSTDKPEHDVQEENEGTKGTTHGSEENERTTHGSEENERTTHGSEENERTTHGSEENERTTHGSEENERTTHGSEENERTTHGSEENERTTHGSEENERTTHGSEENERTTHGSEENERTTHGSEENERTTHGSEENERTTHGSEENEGTTHGSEPNTQGKCERTPDTMDVNEEQDKKCEEQDYGKAETQSLLQTDGKNLKSCKKVHPKEHQEIQENSAQPGLRLDSAYSGCVAPADSLWTVRRDGAVTLKMERSSPASIPPVTVPEFFSRAVSRHGEKTALYSWTGDGWTGTTYLEYYKLCGMVARGLLRLGLERFGGVLILGQNSLEWFVALLGAIMAGGLAVGVDPSCTASWCLGVAEDSQTQIILVQNDHQLQKILEIREKLPRLKAIVQWRGQIKEPLSLLYSWQQLMDLGSELDESDLCEVIQTQRANQCCMVMYEERAEPRGVMLSHDNVTWTCGGIAEMLALSSQEVLLSHLPLNHMAVQMFDLWLPLCCGGTTYFAEAGPWKGSLLSTLKDVRPTYFLGFPELWDKVMRKWLILEEESLQKKVLCWARGTALQACKMPGSLPWGYSIAEWLVFLRARRALGLDNCVFCFAGIRPVCQTVVEYFRSVGVELLDLYGSNESSGMHRMALPVYPKSRRCLMDVPGCTVRVSYTQNGQGLRLWGRHIFMGYLQKPEDTRQTLDDHGWLLTNDLQRRAQEAGRSDSVHENIPRGSAIGGCEKRRGLEDHDLYMEL